MHTMKLEYSSECFHVNWPSVDALASFGYIHHIAIINASSRDLKIYTNYSLGFDIHYMFAECNMSWMKIILKKKSWNHFRIETSCQQTQTIENSKPFYHQRNFPVQHPSHVCKHARFRLHAICAILIWFWWTRPKHCSGSTNYWAWMWCWFCIVQV